MKISDLMAGQGNVEVEGTIIEVGEKRSFNKYGKPLVVSNAILQDDSGTIKLTLWNDDADRFKEGDKIKIVNGYVSEFQGEKQLTSGKFGRIEKLSGGNSSRKITPNKEIKGSSKESKMDPESIDKDVFPDEDYPSDSNEHEISEDDLF